MRNITGSAAPAAPAGLLDAIRERFDERYSASRPPDRADGDLHLEPTGEHPPFGPSTVSVECLETAAPTPVVDAVAAAAHRGRFALLAVPASIAADVRGVLTDPPGAKARDERGNRTFYHVPDRLRVGPEGFGAIRADGELTWRERSEPSGIQSEQTTRIHLEADGDVQAVFDGYGEVACPTPAAFPYHYRRDQDKRIHVRTAEREVGVYTSIRAMKRDAYVPVPDPLVPEVHLPDGAELGGRWAIAAVDRAGAVEIESA